MGFSPEATRHPAPGRSEMMKARDADVARMRAADADARGDHPSNSEWSPRPSWESHTGCVDDPAPDVEMIG